MTAGVNCVLAWIAAAALLSVGARAEAAPPGAAAVHPALRDDAPGDLACRLTATGKLTSASSTASRAAGCAPPFAPRRLRDCSGCRPTLPL